MQPLIQVSTNVGLSVCSLHLGIKSSDSLPRQDYTEENSSNQCVGCSKMQSFEPMCENFLFVVKSYPSSAFGFTDFLRNNCQTNGCVALKIDLSRFRSTAIVFSTNRYSPFFERLTNYVRSETNNFFDSQMFLQY